jgi:hypothetical protein
MGLKQRSFQRIIIWFLSSKWYRKIVSSIVSGAIAWLLSKGMPAELQEVGILFLTGLGTWGADILAEIVKDRGIEETQRAMGVKPDRAPMAVTQARAHELGQIEAARDTAAVADLPLPAPQTPPIRKPRAPEHVKTRTFRKPKRRPVPRQGGRGA